MDTTLAASYRHCRLLHRRYGRSYYLATRLLPAARRRHVHALYGFARYADELVDQIGLADGRRAARFHDWSDRFLAGLTGARVTGDPVLPAVLDTITRYRLEPDDFVRFLKSMAMDLEVTEYRSFPELLSYMEGSAAAIGTMMLPILDPVDPAAAREPARALGIAFQLTNFIRDVAEDLERGRVYLPADELARFGLGTADLRAAATTGQVGPALRGLLRQQVGRARRYYAAAAAGIPLLSGGSQACIRLAYHLYAAILDEVAAAGYNPFQRRAVVPPQRRLWLLTRCLLTPAGAPVRPLRTR